jgi:hypothetical protein
MTPKEFFERVVCLVCRTKIDQKAPFNNGLVCLCRRSVCQVVKSAFTIRSFKLYVNEEILAYVSASDDPAGRPIFYVAEPSRPFYPLIQEHHEIPDYIFLPLDKLIPRLEILTTFS